MMMSSNNGIIHTLVLNSYFVNTPLGMNRKFISMYRQKESTEDDRSAGAVLCSLLNVRSQNWSIPEFQKQDIDYMINELCIH